MSTEDFVHGISKIGNTQAIRVRAVDWMIREELGLIFKSLSDSDVVIDLFLRATFHAIVAKSKRIYLSLQELECVGTLVH